ncbi:MAG: hypothetical protein M0P71_12380 [Melioribacteraceae bacterium]|jgi:hypothetical protein|nr:hypothetical protein [Melioribacteraceae bacterium]
MGIKKSNIERFKKGNDNIFVKGTFNKCNTCPCFNTDQDWGESCNLDFDHQTIHIKTNFYYLSKYCTINHIVGFNDQGDKVKEFYIDKVIIEEELNVCTES